MTYPYLTEFKQLYIRRRGRKQIVFLNIWVIHEQEETIAKQIVKVLYISNVVPMEHIEVLKESTVLGNFDRGYIFPFLI
jgi:hypothetical protein